MMKSSNLLLCSIVASAALAGVAESHSIQGDDWVTLTGGLPTGGTGTSVVVNQAGLPGNISGNISLGGITSLSFSPGTVDADYAIKSQLPNCGTYTCFAADEYEWQSSGVANGGEEYVDLVAGYSTYAASVDALPSAAQLTSAQYNGPFNELPVLTVLFGYGDPSDQGSCANFSGQTASLTVNNVTYTATNPCSLEGNPGVNGNPPAFLTAGPGDLTFINGVLQAGTGVGWSVKAAVSAPEIDSHSAASGLTLLLGGLLVLRGRTAASKH